jgi:hypothetical protein
MAALINLVMAHFKTILDDKNIELVFFSDGLI